MKKTITSSLLAAALSATTGHAAITYVDATTANTTFGDGSAFAPIGGADTDGHWGSRTVFGNGGEIYTSRADEDSPELRTTISGLTAGTYNAYAFYWVAGWVDGNDPTGNNQWDFAAGLASGNTSEYLWNEGTQTQASDFAGTVMVEEGNRRLFMIDLGNVAVDGSGELAIYIDDNPGNDDRTWYDGVGYQTVPEPSSAALIGLGGLSLILRRRK
ncbi:PEP-CTERM sorting domain-containing protein [Verrucomicrobiaceae bacterium N1E253]|uniref:PEP-CTERM sorting domain-containing protein n=1 Tax=Oceaniferula marina TaxID=2748318 RepID=A0A851GDV0_9BACT|nr:PEP-CTERM sorting domain-containing protein [Oceaniferula marina]NWK55596.1 PEP-CTERM sorting domain-containing protein [Oceaniferula marina]